jgi:threonine/homoserine/homoserine lactone efflux protein
MSGDVKAVADAVAVATTVGTVMDILPAVGSVFTIIWLGIRIWESPTVQGMVGKARKKDASDE